MSELDRKRTARILANIRKRDAAKKQGLPKIPRRVGKREDRYLVRQGFYNKLSRIQTVRGIQKTNSHYQAKIGGKVRGEVKLFPSRTAAETAIKQHYDEALRVRLGPKRAGTAKKLFRINGQRRVVKPRQTTRKKSGKKTGARPRTRRTARRKG